MCVPSKDKKTLFTSEVLSKKDFVVSPLNYTGGKIKLLPQILPLFPTDISTFYDLFCGGCNVGINVIAQNHIYSDINTNLIELLKVFQKYTSEQIIAEIEKIIKDYSLSNSSVYGYEYYGCNSSIGLASYNKTPYLNLRNDFNKRNMKDDKYYFMFYTIIIFAFNNQIRFNSNGKYNLPVGKRDFNLKMQNKVRLFSETLQQQNAKFMNMSFERFDIESMDENSFVYVDPPYLASTATYNENNGWNEQDEQKLLHFLDKLHNEGIRFALSNVLINNGKRNEILEQWLKDNEDIYHVHHLQHSYANSNYHRKGNKDTDEVLITNY